MQFVRIYRICNFAYEHHVREVDVHLNVSSTLCVLWKNTQNTIILLDVNSYVLSSYNPSAVMTREGWPSGKMSDCNARGREFKSWLGQKINLQKVMGSDGKL